jgi:hypothetical protein
MTKSENGMYAFVMFNKREMLSILTVVSGVQVVLTALFARPSVLDEPLTRMISFASHQATRFNQTSIADLQLSQYITFVDSACVTSASLQSARVSLASQLVSFPPQVRDKIVDMALTLGVSVKTARQNMSNVLSSDEVFVYTYYINTRFHNNEYRSCVLASGIRLVIGETVVGAVEERSTEIAGYQPCHCGVLYCEKCPILRETVTNKPVFARHSGTIDWHVQLHKHGRAPSRCAGCAIG